MFWFPCSFWCDFVEVARDELRADGCIWELYEICILWMTTVCKQIDDILTPTGFCYSIQVSVRDWRISTKALTIPRITFFLHILEGSYKSLTEKYKTRSPNLCSNPMCNLCFESVSDDPRSRWGSALRRRLLPQETELPPQEDQEGQDSGMWTSRI